MTEVESLTTKIESGSLFTVSVTYDNDPLRQVLIQILQQVKSNTEAISFLKSGKEIPASVSEDQDLATRLSMIEERLTNLEKGKPSPMVNSDPQVLALLESEDSKDLSNENIVNIVKNLKYETDQRINNLEQDIKQLNLRSKQPVTSTEKGGESAFEYNRSNLSYNH